MSWKRWEHASCFENLPKPPSTEKMKWIMFSIELFWGSIFEGEGVSHPESKVWGKFRNKSYAFFEFMKPGFALFWPYCSGRPKSGCGGCVCGRYQWFLPPTLCLISWKIGHNYAKVIYINEFHRFWWVFEHRNNMYEIWPKWEKTQACRPRPGRPAYPPGNLGSSLVRVLMSANTSKSNMVLYKMHKPIPKGLSHDKLGFPVVTKLRTKS